MYAMFQFTLTEARWTKITLSRSKQIKWVQALQWPHPHQWWCFQQWHMCLANAEDNQIDNCIKKNSLSSNSCNRTLTNRRWSLPSTFLPVQQSCACEQTYKFLKKSLTFWNLHAHLQKPDATSSFYFKHSHFLPPDCQSSKCLFFLTQFSIKNSHLCTVFPTGLLWHLSLVLPNGCFHALLQLQHRTCFFFLCQHYILWLLLTSSI
jgi:hypothetical protein